MPEVYTRKYLKQLFSFMTFAGLSFGHFDFVRGEDGQFIFLECNPNGMWAFYDRDNIITTAYANFFVELFLMKYKLIIPPLLIIISFIVTSCVSRENVQVDNESEHVDIFSLNIKEPVCPADIPRDEICELPNISKRAAEGLFRDVRKAVGDNTHQITYKDSLLTIAVANPKQKSMVCCDIQSSLRAIKLKNGNLLGYVQFNIPSKAYLELHVIGAAKLIGPTTLYNQLDTYQSHYLKFKKHYNNKLTISEFHIKGFARTLYEYRAYPEKTPDFLFYFKDGEGMQNYANIFESFYTQKRLLRPNVAFIGIASAPSVQRRDEYLKDNTKDINAYQRYLNVFSNTIVPAVESRLNYTKGASNRVLVGKSNGATWALNYFLDHPDFACTALVLSLGGKAPSIKSNAGNLACKAIYLGAGLYEPRFATKTEEVSQALSAVGYSAQYSAKPSGHSDSTWLPLFLEFLDTYSFNAAND